MKLKVGQKIGIWKIREDSSLYKKGDQILANHYFNKNVSFKGFSIPLEIGEYVVNFNRHEVRKVGSLIVKRLK